jgi:hypothetical protein
MAPAPPAEFNGDYAAASLGIILKRWNEEEAPPGGRRLQNNLLAFLNLLE